MITLFYTKPKTNTLNITVKADTVKFKPFALSKISALNVGDVIIANTFTLSRLVSIDTSDDIRTTSFLPHRFNEVSVTDVGLLSTLVIFRFDEIGIVDSVSVTARTVYNVIGDATENSFCSDYTYANGNATTYPTPPPSRVTYSGQARGLVLNSPLFAVGKGDFTVYISANLSSTNQTSGLVSSALSTLVGIEIWTSASGGATIWRVGASETRAASNLGPVLSTGDHSYIFQRASGVIYGWIDGSFIGSGYAKNVTDRAVNGTSMCLGAKYANGANPLNSTSYVYDFTFYPHA